jgi:hypothetical protein
MQLKITYSGTMRGQKLYAVSGGGDRFFTGTLEEVKRYIIIHNEKIRQRRDHEQALLAAMRAAG